MESFKKIKLSIPDQKATYLLLHGNSHMVNSSFQNTYFGRLPFDSCFCFIHFFISSVKKTHERFQLWKRKKNRAKKVAREKFASHELILLVETSGNSFTLHTTLSYIIEH